MNADRLLQWAGTLFQVIGVFGLSSRLVEPPSAFAVMLAGSLIWLWVSASAREWPLAALNAVFTVSNVVGIARWAEVAG